MTPKLIKDFVVGDKVEGFFAIRRHEIKESVRGQFVSMDVSDHSGHLQAIDWEPDSTSLHDLAPGMAIKIRGSVGEYNNKKQLIIQKVRIANDDEYEMEDLLPHSPYSREERKARLIALRDTIVNSHIQQLVDSFFNDEEFFDKFLISVAGKLWHHAYVGGLADHSANVAELAVRVSSGYPFLDKDLLIFGGIFHDIGKVETYKMDASFDYTDEGRLIGHICLADNWITERAKTIDAFPSKLLMKLRHLILSHQGELEYATPVVPQTPEAFILYFCDEIDSKMGAVDRIRTKFDGQGWSDYVKLLNRYLYFGEQVKPDESNG